MIRRICASLIGFETNSANLATCARTFQRIQLVNPLILGGFLVGKLRPEYIWAKVPELIDAKLRNFIAPLINSVNSYTERSSKVFYAAKQINCIGGLHGVAL